jgi:hypothetical protein
MSCPVVIRVTTATGPPGVGLPAGTADAGKFVRKAGSTPYVYELVALDGSSNAVSTYVHNQPTASTNWTISHNLGFKPSVELLNTGSQEIEGDVVHQSTNVCQVYFSTPIAGFARLN